MFEKAPHLKIVGKENLEDKAIIVAALKEANIEPFLDWYKTKEEAVEHTGNSEEGQRARLLLQFEVTELYIEAGYGDQARENIEEMLDPDIFSAAQADLRQRAQDLLARIDAADTGAKVIKM